jgi:cation diffusion facilitator family transporter
MQEGSKKAIIAAFIANLGIAIAKFVGFILTQSAGLLAESVHSLADTGNQALLLFGSKRARKEANSLHPFGYGRERYFWSFVVALVLFSMGGLFALYEGIQKISDPHETDNLAIAIGILVAAILLESYSLSTAVKEAQRIKPKSQSWLKFIKSAKQPELPVVLLEDVGAEIGLFLALGGVITAHYTHDPRWDAVGSISIGVLLVIIAAFLAIEMKGLLIGESALDSEVDSINQSIVSHQAVVAVIHLRTEHLSPDELLVAAKVEFVHSLSILDLSAAINEVEALIRGQVPSARFIFIEPDIAHSTILN